MMSSSASPSRDRRASFSLRMPMLRWKVASRMAIARSTPIDS